LFSITYINKIKKRSNPHSDLPVCSDKIIAFCFVMNAGPAEITNNYINIFWYLFKDISSL